MDTVMDKYGSPISEYKYPDWDEYISACVLSRCVSDIVSFTPIFEGDKKENKESVMERILKCFDHPDVLKSLESVVTDDTYYVYWSVKRQILKKKIYEILKSGEKDLREILYSICKLDEMASECDGVFRQMEAHIYHIHYDCKGQAVNVDYHVNEIAKYLVVDYKLARIVKEHGRYPNGTLEFEIYRRRGDGLYPSIKLMTENFEDNPIKAFIRAHHFQMYTTGCFEMHEDLLQTYWIYFFSSSQKEYVEAFSMYLPLEKLDMKKAREYMNYKKVQNPIIIFESLKKLYEKYRAGSSALKEQYEQELAQLLKNTH